MPAALAIPALIGAGGQIASSVIGARTAKKVGQQQADAAGRASQLQQNAANQSIAQQGGLLGVTQDSYRPYTALGTQAAGLLSGMADRTPDAFRGTTAADLETDPGYQFRLLQGQKALERSAAARGTLLTGGTAKALSDYGQQAGSQEFGHVDARRFRDYQQGQVNDQTRFGNLSSLLNFGAGQNQNLQGLNLGYAGLMGQPRAQGAGAGANGITDAANANAAGQVGQANAWSSGLNNITGNIQQLLMLQQLLARQPGAQR